MEIKAVLIYDSVSSSKMPAKVADVVASTLKDKGVEVTSVPVGDAKHIDVGEYDLLVIGTPTMAWAPTKDIREFLDSLDGVSFAGKKAASFDTQIRSIISGNANRAVEKMLRGLGFSIACPHLQSYVKGENKAYRMLEGELDKAADWAKGLAASLAAKG